MLMKLALEKDFKFQNWVDSVFYLCTPKLGDGISSLNNMLPLSDNFFAMFYLDSKV